MHSSRRNIKIAIVVSHPIQHFCPWYASIAQIPELTSKVFFGSKLGASAYTDENFNKEIKWNNLYLDQFEHVFLNGDAILPSNANLDAGSLNEALNSFNPDAVIVYGHWQKLSKRAYKWCVRSNIKVVYISDSELHSSGTSFKNWIKKIYLSWYFKKIFRFLVVGDANADYYKQCGIDNNRLIYSPFPIDIKLYESKKCNYSVIRSGVRNKFNMEEADVVITFVGKLVEWKCPQHIISAMELLEQDNVRYIFLIAGSGELEESLKKQALNLKKGKVLFAGFVNPEDLPDLYAATDIYIHPSAYEPHSLAISEALFMGCPLLLSNQCGSYGMSDDLQPGTNGFVYRYGNIQEMASAIKFIAKDKDIRNSFSEKSFSIGALKQQQAHSNGIQALINILKQTTA